MKKQDADENTCGRNVKRSKPWYGATGENIVLIAVFVVVICIFALDRCGGDIQHSKSSSLIVRDTVQLGHHPAGHTQALRLK